MNYRIELEENEIITILAIIQYQEELVSDEKKKELEALSEKIKNGMLNRFNWGDQMTDKEKEIAKREFTLECKEAASRITALAIKFTMSVVEFKIDKKKVENTLDKFYKMIETIEGIDKEIRNDNWKYNKASSEANES